MGGLHRPFMPRKPLDALQGPDAGEQLPGRTCSSRRLPCGERGVWGADVVVVAKVDIDAARDIAMRYKITSIPTLIVFKGGVPVESTRGVQTKAALEAMIGRATAAATAAS